LQLIALTVRQPSVSDRRTEKVNLSAKLQQFTERWSPRIVGELNGQQVKLAKFEGLNAGGKAPPAAERIR
jgi:hypothetical protein